MNKVNKFLLLLAVKSIFAAAQEVCEDYFCATVAGDPHVTSFDGLKWDCQGQGEFVLVTTKDSKDGEFPLQIHGTFVNPYDFEPSDHFDAENTKFVSVTRAAAFRVHKDVPKLRVYVKDQGDIHPESEEGTTEPNWCPLQYDEELDVVDENLKAELEARYPGIKEVKTFPPLFKNGRFIDKIKIIFGDNKGKITISSKYGNFGCVLTVRFCMDVHEHGGRYNLVGLYGTPDHRTSNDWMESSIGFDGISVPDYDKKEMRKLGTAYCMGEWCLDNPADSMFEEDYFSPRTTNCNSNFNHEQLNQVITKIEDICGEYFEELKADNVQPTDASIIEAAFAIECHDQAVEHCITECPGEQIKTETLDEEDDMEDDDDEPDPCRPSSAPTIPSVPEIITLQPTPQPTTNPTKAPTPGSNGDPHFKTWKQEHFEYHGQCDMILTKDTNFANGLGLEIQIRTKLVRFWSYIKSAAIRIGDDILELEGTSNDSDPSINYWINLEYQGELKTLGGFPVTIRSQRNYKRFFDIDLSSKYPNQKIVISFFHEFVSVKVENASEEAFGNTVGMLGNFKTGQTLARDGATVLEDFYEYGSEWQVLPSDGMLFHSVEQPQFPEKCLEPEDPQGERRRRLGESTVSEAEAEKACASISHPLDRKDCIYDILATQDVGMVGAY